MEEQRHFKSDVLEVTNTPLECYREVDSRLIKLGVNEGVRQIVNDGEFAEWLRRVCS